MGSSKIERSVKKPLNKIINKLYESQHELLVSTTKKTVAYTSTPNLVFLIPPTTAGSLGDEAMLVAVYTRLISEGKNCIIVSGDVEGNERLKLYGLNPEEIGVNGLYDGFWGIKKFQKVLLKHQPESVYLIGADVMDGFYSIMRSINRLTILKLAAEFCQDSRLLGFSFNAEPEEKVLNFFKKCSGKFKIQPRDPISSERLTAHGIENKCVADLAFMLKPDSSLRENLPEGDYICINLNAIHLNKWGNEFFDLTVGMVEHLFNNTAFSIVFISHDFRKFDGVSDYDFSKLVAQKLNIDNSKRVTFVDEYATAAQLKGTVKGAQFTLTGRMHFAIASLGNAVPTLMIGYQGKQEGLAKHFELDLSKTVITPTSSLQNAIMILKDVEDRRDEIFEKLNNRLPVVQELSLSNIR
tara:strand:- start:92 stop:1324 length:1233 start_codon:yes stop_codon:yes gene_type:complete